MTNNTIPNVPRDLLERVIMSTHMYWPAAPLIKEIRALLSAPSPAGVDGLEVIGWYTEDHLDDKSATTYSREVADRWLAKGWPITGIANADNAQAIIDGLRGELDDPHRLARHSKRLVERLRTDRDQHAQRIGELEVLLRAESARVDFLDAYIVTADAPDTGKAAMLADSGTLRECIDAALSAGKDTAP